MIKGCQKKMIVLQKIDGKYFTEAFFVLREDCDLSARHADMVAEANRIVDESLHGVSARFARKKKQLSRAAALLYFSLGAASTGALSLVLFLIFR